MPINERRLTNGEHASAALAHRLRALLIRILSFVIATIICLATPKLLCAAPDLSAPDAAVEAGREALQDHWNLNWYDPESDDLAPLDLPPPKPPSWSFWTWLGDILSAWNMDLSGLFTFLFWLAAALLIGGVVYVLIKAFRDAELKLAVRGEEELDDGRAHIERVEALPVSLERPVGDFLQEARRLAASGDLSLAIVYLFSHQLMELDKRHQIRLVKGKTNRQYLRELRRNAPNHPQIGRLVEQTMLLFEGAFFGAHPPAEQKFAECLQATERMAPLLEDATARQDSAERNTASEEQRRSNHV